MQAYQYEQISADPDKPLADGIRALDTTDMERYPMQASQEQYNLAKFSAQGLSHRNPIYQHTKVTFLTGKFMLGIHIGIKD